MSSTSIECCSVPEQFLLKFKAFLILTVFAFSSMNVFAQTSSISDCDDFIIGAGASWPYVLEATLASEGVSSLDAQTFTMNVTSLPETGANFRIFKTTPTGNYFGNLTALQLGVNTFTVAAYTASDEGFTSRAVKFQFSSGEVEFDALSINGQSVACLPEPTTSTVSICSDFVSGSNTLAKQLEDTPFTLKLSNSISPLEN